MNRPTYLSIVKTDFIALIAVLFPIVGIVLGVIAALGWLPDRFALIDRSRDTFFDPDSAPIFFALAVASLVGGLLVLKLRISKIHDAFDSARFVPGIITKFSPFKDRAYITYRYSIDGHEFSTRHLIHLTQRAKCLKTNQTVTIAVSSTKPANGFIKELFFDEEKDQL